MLKFLLQRLATLVPTLFFVSVLIFGLQQLLPGDPAKVLAGEDQDPAVVAYLTQKMHLDKPLPVRYVYWLGGVLTVLARMAAAAGDPQRCVVAVAALQQFIDGTLLTE